VSPALEHTTTWINLRNTGTSIIAQECATFHTARILKTGSAAGCVVHPSSPWYNAAGLAVKRAKAGSGKGMGNDEQSVAAFAGALASAAPTPGGGAASAVAGALAAALAEMVGNLTVGRPRYQAVEAEGQRLLVKLGDQRATLLRLVDEDAAAYNQVAVAYALPRQTEEQKVARERAIQAALLVAMEPPRAIAGAALACLRATVAMAAIGNPNVISDAGCAAILAEAALRCANLNVLANVALMRDQPAGPAAQAECAAREAEAAPLVAVVLAAVRERLGRTTQ
jgi:formiminotetrahydrofolate cyclodeaminase